MLLHTINKPGPLDNCRDLIAADDHVLLIEDGVYLALTEMKTAFVLKADVEARGLSSRLPESITMVDYTGFVRLADEADKVCAWF